jgi:hypothetical protein
MSDLWMSEYHVQYFDGAVVCFTNPPTMPDLRFGVMHAGKGRKFKINLQIMNDVQYLYALRDEDIQRKASFRFRPATAQECQGLRFSFEDVGKTPVFRDDELLERWMNFGSLFKLDYLRLINAGADPIKLSELQEAFHEAWWQVNRVFDRASKGGMKRGLESPEARAYLQAGEPADGPIADACLQVQERESSKAMDQAAKNPKMIAFREARCNIMEYALQFTDLSC